ncbi:hypothetical protein [Acaryochloris marina]|uniref:Uncharacterized protein n=1 Tax=Acaryochloris marina (strain MBIC 11017) TaxID=329726 RepID=B0C3Z0_ACAM1|nr:hypothetical protein [Acaryochloris marina]ABW26250.1 conserved hypothetical protein [Acaryochloris marina MBIC11017]
MKKSWHPIFPISLWILVGGGWLSGCSLLAPKVYKPTSPQIEQLAIDTMMTQKAQQLFYQQEPRIEPKKTFHKLCRKASHNTEKTILLGCFISDGYEGSIIIQSVTDPRLDGMMEMVAAHEMLHAAYQQLSNEERSQLASKLKRAAKRVKDEHLLAVLKEYESGDQDLYVNELHSHLGTSLGDLGDPELEEYYRQYFRDRKQVVAFSDRSRRVLAKIESQVDQLEPELNSLEINLKAEKDYIQRAEDDLKTYYRDLERMKTNLTRLKQQAEASLSRGDDSLVNDFEQARSRFNSEVGEFNGQIQQLQDRIQQFNQQYDAYSQKVNFYNELAATNRSILSSIKLAPSEKVKPVAP